MSKFKVGDIVEWCGVRGEVNRSDGNPKRPVGISFKQICDAGYEYVHWFTLDGRAEAWHKEPSLKLIKRKPFRWEGKVEWKQRFREQNCYTVVPFSVGIPKDVCGSDKFIGKTGILTFVEDEK